MARNSQNYAGPRIFGFGDLQCPACWNGNAPQFLGGLGARAHFRCRDCGLDFSISAADADTDVLFDIQND